MENNYAVIFTYSFSSETPVYLFPSEDSAVKFLRERFEEEVRIDAEESEWDCEHYISEDGWYARITTSFDDGDDIMEMRVGVIYQ